MAIITTSQNLTGVSYSAGEIIEIRNGATLTIDSTPATRPGTIQCITSGKLLIENTSTSTPLVLELERNNRNLRFEGNAIIEIKGAPMEIWTSDGTAKSWDFSTLYSGAITDITYVEVETAPSSGEYMPWFIANITPDFYAAGFPLANRGSTQKTIFDAEMEVIFWDSLTRELSTGDGTNGKLIPNGCKVRIPNILITNQDWQPDVSFAHRIESTGSPTGGTFTITLIDRRTGTTIGTTGNIAFNAAATTVRDAVIAVLGAGTVTSSGGPLPTAVSLTLAGAYLNTPLAMVVNSSVTGGTNSTIFSLENASTNLTLLDLNPSGTIDAEWVSFSQKVRTVNSSYSRVKLKNTGIGGDAINFANSNGSLDLDTVNFTFNPKTVPSNPALSNISSNVKIKKLVIAVATFGNASISTLPELEVCEDVRVLGWGSRTSGTAVVALNFITLPNIPIVRPLAIGGRINLTNLTGNVIVQPRHSDTPGIQTTVNAAGVIVTTNCIDITIAYLSKYGTSSARNAVFATDAASSNVLVVGGSYNMNDHGAGVIGQHNGAKVAVKNFNLSGSRTNIQSFDAPTNFACTEMSGEKVYVEGGQALTPSLDSNQDGKYDLVGCDLNRLIVANVSVENFIGGNFMDTGLTPTTGHISFFAFGVGEGLEITGGAYTDQIGSIFLPNNNDTAEMTIPYAMHGVTSFQNVSPRFQGECPDGFARAHRIANTGGVTGGTFTISVYDETDTLIGTTAAIAHNSSTATVDAAVEAVTGAGSVTVSGNLTTGYIITFLTGVIRRLTADGTNLTGGEFPGTIEYYARYTITEDNEIYPGLEFACRVPNGTWGAYQTLNGTNLSGAIAALTGYSAGNGGLEMRLKLTATGDFPARRIQQVSLRTNIDPDLWTIKDSFIKFNGPNPTDVIHIRRVADLGENPPINLYSFTGGGVHDLDVGANFGEEVFFVREDSAGTVLMRSLPFTQKLAYGNLGEIDLFYGAEIQLAQASTLESLNALVEERLDATITSRLANTADTKLDGIKKNTDLIPGAL
jgi:hypothetical protein